MIENLIARVEAAEGPSLELDADIHEAVTTFRPRRAGPGWPYEDALVVPVFPGWSLLPQYSASLDAAMTLVPEGWSWSLGEMRGVGKFRAWLNDHNTPDGIAVRHVDKDAATPALALVAACLRARQGAKP